MVDFANRCHLNFRLAGRRTKREHLTYFPTNDHIAVRDVKGAGNIDMKSGNSFRKVAKGGAVFLGGRLGAGLLQLLTTILVVRMVERSEYGLISLGTVAITMLSIFSLLGIKTAVPRYIGKYRAQHDEGLVGAISGTALACALVMSLLFAAVLHFEADIVSQVFNKPELRSVFETLALMLPAMVLIETLTAVFRGLENVRAKVIFQDVGLPLMRLLLLVPLALAGLGLHEILYIYVISAWLALGLFVVYARKMLKDLIRLQFSMNVATDLLWFSLPLLAIEVMNNLTVWTAMFTLGYLRPAAEVAAFSVPLRIGAFIAAPLVALIYLYIPIASKHAERGEVDEVRSLYLSITKWAFVVTLPIQLYLLVDAEFAITLLFGDEYLDAANVLRIIILGQAINAFTGPNGPTLVAFGNTRTQFYATLFAAISAVGLCLLLIPNYGAMGAAAGAATAKWGSQLYVSYVLYRKFNIHPVTSEFLKPVAVTIIGTIAIASLAEYFGDASSILWHAIIFIAILVFTLAAPFLTRTLSQNDLDLMASMENRIFGHPKLVPHIQRWLNRGNDAGRIE